MTIDYSLINLHCEASDYTHEAFFDVTFQPSKSHSPFISATLECLAICILNRRNENETLTIGTISASLAAIANSSRWGPSYSARCEYDLGQETEPRNSVHARTQSSNLQAVCTILLVYPIQNGVLRTYLLRADVGGPEAE